MARPQVEMRYLDVEPPKLQLRLATFPGKEISRKLGKDNAKMQATNSHAPGLRPTTRGNEKGIHRLLAGVNSRRRQSRREFHWVPSRAAAILIRRCDASSIPSN
jgi:hypothetical protein